MTKPKIERPRLTVEQRRRLLRWVEALESGRYHQVEHALREKINEKKYGYCCLGVACNVYHLETGFGRWGRPESDCYGDGEEPRNFIVTPPDAKKGERGDYGIYEEESIMPKVVADWFGIDANPVFINEKGHSENATVWNDDEGMNFKQIAALIRHTFGLPRLPATEGKAKKDKVVPA